MTRKLVTFTGNNGAGAITVTGVEAGDLILQVMFETGGIAAGTAASGFASFVVVNGQVLQNIATDYSIYTFAALLERDVMLP